MKMYPRPERIHKILVVTLSNLGDVVLTYPVFESLRRAFPAARLDAAVGKNGAAALEGHPAIRHVIILDKKISFLKKSNNSGTGMPVFILHFLLASIVLRKR